MITNGKLCNPPNDARLKRDCAICNSYIFSLREGIIGVRWRFRVKVAHRGFDPIDVAYMPFGEWCTGSLMRCLLLYAQLKLPNWIFLAIIVPLSCWHIIITLPMWPCWHKVQVWWSLTVKSLSLAQYSSSLFLPASSSCRSTMKIQGDQVLRVFIVGVNWLIGGMSFDELCIGYQMRGLRFYAQWRFTELEHLRDSSGTFVPHHHYFALHVAFFTWGGKVQMHCSLTANRWPKQFALICSPARMHFAYTMKT